MNSFGWRFGSLVFGTLLVLVTIRLVRRVSRSTLIGGLAGLLLTFDGLAFVMSRTALLDIFLAFFLVAAVACLAADRDWFRHRLADHLQRQGLTDLGGRFGPALLVRPWRLAAGVCFGLALGSKWNGAVRAGRVRAAQPGLGRRRPPAGRRRCPGELGGAARRRARLRVPGGAQRSGVRRHLGQLVRHLGRLRPGLGRRAIRRPPPPGGWAPTSPPSCTTSATSGTSTPATSSTTRSTPTAPTRRAGWCSPARSPSTRSTTSSPGRTAASAPTTASG